MISFADLFARAPFSVVPGRLAGVISSAAEVGVPAPLDVDLRQRAVDAYVGGHGTLEEVAGRFVVGTASLKRWLRSWRTAQSVEPKPATGGRPAKLDERCEEVLRVLVAEQPDAYCWELAERLGERTGVKVNEDTVGRALSRMGVTRKKRRSKPRSSSDRT